jgi:hypothetical protein
MRWLGVRDFGSWLPQRLVKISYQASLLILKVLAFPVFYISSALWVVTGNVLFQSALIVAAGEHLGQAF